MAWFSLLLAPRMGVQLPTVLVIDDEAGPRESLRAILRTHFRVLTAASGAAALEILKREQVDVVTLDLRMADLPGLKVLAEIKSHDPDIEVLIITGYGSLESAVAGLRLRAFDYLCKPFDVRRVRELVARALARRQTAQRLQRVKENFFGNMSHEFRTPLNAIMGYTSILLEDEAANLTPEQRYTLDRIRINSYDLLTYIDTALYLSALESGEVPLVVSDVDAAEVAAQVVGAAQVKAESKQVNLRLEGNGGPLRIRTDAEKLRRLLLALVENSIRSTEKGEITVAVQAAEERGIRVEVRDAAGSREEGRRSFLLTGPADEDVPDRRRPDLELRLIRRLARALGASAELEGGPGQGSRFRLLVPSLPTPTETADEAVTARNPTSPLQ